MITLIYCKYKIFLKLIKSFRKIYHRLDFFFSDEHYKDGNPEKSEESTDPEELTPYQGKLSLEEGLKDAHIDHRRIINIKDGLSTSTLYEFIPASKIKGIDKMMSESTQLEYYKQSVDFPIAVEKESSFDFPDHLKVYTYEKCNVTSFPHPKKGRTGVYGNKME